MAPLSLLSLFVLSGSTRITPEPVNGTELSLMTFNIRTSNMPDGINEWSARRGKALSLLERLHPALVGFQEVMPDQRHDLQSGLGEYVAEGEGRDGNGEGEESPIFWRGHKDYISRGTFWLSKTPDQEGSQGWDASCPRVCSWVRWRNLTVFNAHLDDQGAESRYEALKLIRSKAGTGTYIIMGDFNDRAGSAALQPLEGMVDAYKVVHPHTESTSYHAFQGSDYRGPRIDFIYVTPDIEVLDADLVRSEGPIYPSDHYPLVARLKLPRPMSSDSQ